MLPLENHCFIHHHRLIHPYDPEVMLIEPMYLSLQRQEHLLQEGGTFLFPLRLCHSQVDQQFISRLIILIQESPWIYPQHRPPELFHVIPRL